MKWEGLELAEQQRDAAFARDRVAELERRIRVLHELDDASLGCFTRWDWLLCVVGGLLAPIAALWWFAG